MKVLRWQVAVADHELPIGGWPVLHVAPDRLGRFDTVDVWAMEADMRGRTPMEAPRLQIFRTGHEVPDGAQYVGTAVTAAHHVWHVFLMNPEKGPWA